MFKERPEGSKGSSKIDEIIRSWRSASNDQNNYLQTGLAYENF